ncbi:ATP-dependent DNA helicase RecG [Capillimicrobium parvum]|uniref:Probable DNA 3'-5' helicase RecG n=1 Tax=Capillimicrobium parvum TaxID=2884022 RepID=A0A9E6XWN7_9ACTN|nr:ATP-dependent DNA helicase RecG [Capillimicrobium parvum]UGS35829.1 ATP-dependent DNA helicase RecG [Capillimicrobium parvum]
MGPFDSADPAAVAVRLPRPSRLEQAVEAPHPKVAEALETLGLRTVGDLLWHLPRERRVARQVAELAVGEQANVLVEVRSIRSRPVRRRGMKPLVEATVADATGVMKVVFFNQPWLERRYRPGTRLALYGKYDGRNSFKVSSHSETLDVGAAVEGIAHYPATEGITSTQLAEMVRAHRAAIGDVIEPLPAALRVAERLPDRAAALADMHFGDGEPGRVRLAFDELLSTQLLFARRRALHAAIAAPALDGPRRLTERWLADALPFTPTGDQSAAMEAVEADLARRRPMQRLLMGEVGSGKTVVALFALLRAVEHGMQGAFMAPTETLAEQHFATVQNLLGAEPVSAALLTGSTPAGRRADVLGKLGSGELSLVVGTHALIEPAVVFDRLAVAVVDEQHRFGVRQRSALDAKGPGHHPRDGIDSRSAPGDGRRLAPHVLHMTATPIPRTMRLLEFGDLEHTAIHELPGGRKPIRTFVASTDAERERAYERIREELRAGRQAFVVCPLVEESEALQARAATSEFERLARGELSDFRLVLLHGQMRPRDKQAAMASFAAGGADVLVATSVIEVGIDVPNATVMLVENAERYGISQLHQLRGRIGRGGHASVCILFGPKESKRLRALAEHADGFRLAEIDLELRREGELVGTRQSGYGEFDVARLPEDEGLLERARRRAAELLASDPELQRPENALLADALRERYGVAELDLPIPA